ncbi:MAG: hypothetical protein OXC19_02570, partial [Bryobacterales bacterium]|nr:hypothetical protein [Bryobacterales bacterium]
QFENGHVFSVNTHRNGLIVTHQSGQPRFDKYLELPDVHRVSVRDIAVSPDGRVAAIAGATDWKGRNSSDLAMLDMDGNMAGTIPTYPFVSDEIGFTGDGSLWAMGREIEPGERMIGNQRIGQEKPVHDILRQYDRDGKFVRSLLPRLSVSTDRRHPAYDASLGTSKNYVAILSNLSGYWALVSTDGLIVSSGHLEVHEKRKFMNIIPTDSGELYVTGMLRGPLATTHREKHGTNVALYRLDRDTGQLEAVDLGANSGLIALGSDGENLVFRDRFSETGFNLAWGLTSSF